MMKEMIFENGIQYSLHGDYYLPDFRIEQEPCSLGRWSRMHRDHLKKHRPVDFVQLSFSGKLWNYLADIDKQAQQQMDILIKQMMTCEGITEQLKEADQMEWVRKMNSIRLRAEEILLEEIIYT